MKKYLSGGAVAAIAGAAMMLSFGVSPAEAQAPGGSYLRTCTDVRMMGDRVSATCRRTDGTWRRTVLRNVDTCVGGLANANGRLTCGRSERRFARDRDHYRERDWRHRDHRWQGYGSSYQPRQHYNYNQHYWYGR